MPSTGSHQIYVRLERLAKLTLRRGYVQCANDSARCHLLMLSLSLGCLKVFPVSKLFPYLLPGIFTLPR